MTTVTSTVTIQLAPSTAPVTVGGDWTQMDTHAMVRNMLKN